MAAVPTSHNKPWQVHLKRRDVQEMVIMGIHARGAGRLGEDTFTIKEPANELRLLIPWGSSGAMYSPAHITKCMSSSRAQSWTLTRSRLHYVQVLTANEAKDTPH